MSSTGKVSCRVDPSIHSDPYFRAAMEVRAEDAVRSAVGLPNAPVTLTWYESEADRYALLVAEVTSE